MDEHQAEPGGRAAAPNTLAFRNVDVSPEHPISAWPLEVIQTALERGGLSYWRRLADEIRAQPWGSVARGVEEVLTYSRPYGVAELMERAVSMARDAAATSERQRWQRRSIGS